MIAKVLGVERVSYKFDNGSYSGKKIHCIEMDYSSDGLKGQRVNVLKVSDEGRFANFPFVVGNEYEVHFSQRGALDYVVPHQVEDPAGYVDHHI